VNNDVLNLNKLQAGTYVSQTQRDWRRADSANSATYAGLIYFLSHYSRIPLLNFYFPINFECLPYVTAKNHVVISITFGVTTTISFLRDTSLFRELCSISIQPSHGLLRDLS
jgi:hypothetical protein